MYIKYQMLASTILRRLAYILLINCLSVIQVITGV